MIIMKFGGTSVGNASQIKKVHDIVSSQRSRNPLVVVSALSGITHHLTDLCSGMTDYNIAEFQERHLTVLHELGLSKDLLNEEFQELTQLLQGIHLLQECSLRTKDRILSFGERCSAKIIGNYFTSSLYVPSYDLGLKTNSNFGHATPLKESYQDIQKAVLSYKDKIIVTTGFIAKDPEGNITTLGRGGSDYSASLFGAALHATEIQIWTDVSGIMTTDPRMVHEAKPIREMSFQEASELPYYVAKVIHPATMLPAMEKNIPVRILNTNDPSHPGTTVYKHTPKTQGTVKAIAHRNGLIVINITSTRMLDQYGFLARIFEIFSRHKTSVDMVSTSEVSVSLTIDNEQHLSSIVSELETFSEVSVEKHQSIMSVVGEGLRQDHTVPARIFSILSQHEIPVRMVSLGASKINLSFLLKESQTKNALTVLHKEFFQC